MRKAVASLCFILAVAIPATSRAVDLDDVIGMLEAGVSEDAISRLIQEEDAVFNLDSDDLIDLKNAGASDDLIEDMLERSVDWKTDRTGYDHGGYDAYVSISYGFDPFDYYFMTWPYYYSYMAPFRFAPAWWYYGGPCAWYWCDDWGYRTCGYYNERWGGRVVWSRGYRDTRYHRPSQDYKIRTAAYRAEKDRTAYSVAPRGNSKSHRSWDRHGRIESRPRPGYSERSSRPEKGGSEQAPRSRTWGRGDRKSPVGKAVPERAGQAPQVRRPTPPGAPSGGRSDSPRSGYQGGGSRSTPGTAVKPAAPSKPAQSSPTSRPSPGRPAR